jgi:hypothetical protein
VSAEFKQGDEVAWNTPQGETTGKVKKKLTKDERVGNEGQKGTKVSASKDDPRYLVESDKSGKVAAHKPGALKKR